MNDLQRKEFILKSRKIGSLISAIPDSSRAFDVEVKYIKDTIESFEDRYGSFNFHPDFQRGLVWSEDQQIAYIESLIRGACNLSSISITINNPEFGGSSICEGCDVEKGFVVVDGLQRLTAIINFVDGRFKIFKKELGGVGLEYFSDTMFNLGSKTIRFNIFNIQSRKTLLKLYKALNTGGTAHTNEEIEKVDLMIEKI